MVTKIQASAFIICQDEEQHIATVLGSVADFAEVILMDSGSTDKTLEIAATFANVTIFHQDWLGYAKQKECARKKCRHKWVLSLDSDQQLSAALKQRIIKTLANDKKIDALDIPIIDTQYIIRPASRFIRHNTSIKFFKKDKGHFLQVTVHETVQVDGRVKRVKEPIYHSSVQSIEEMVEKNNLYSTLRVVDKVKNNKRPSRVKLFSVFFVMFCKSYFFKRHILSGTEGFVVAMTQAYYAFLKEAKLFAANRKDK